MRAKTAASVQQRGDVVESDMRAREKPAVVWPGRRGGQSGRQSRAHADERRGSCSRTRRCSDARPSYFSFYLSLRCVYVLGLARDVSRWPVPARDTHLARSRFKPDACPRFGNLQARCHVL